MKRTQLDSDYQKQKKTIWTIIIAVSILCVLAIFKNKTPSIKYSELANAPATSLSELDKIKSDPNYINANEATKAAILAKYSKNKKTINVRMPDGRVINDLPENITQTEVLALLNDAKTDYKKDCENASNFINKSTPKTLDKYTTLLTTFCSVKDKVYLNYVDEIKIDDKTHLTAILKELHQYQINQWCSTPQTKNLLNRISANFIYYDENGNYIETNSFNSFSCKE